MCIYIDESITVPTLIMNIEIQSICMSCNQAHFSFSSDVSICGLIRGVTIAPSWTTQSSLASFPEAVSPNWNCSMFCLLAVTTSVKTKGAIPFNILSAKGFGVLHSSSQSEVHVDIYLQLRSNVFPTSRPMPLHYSTHGTPARVAGSR